MLAALLDRTCHSAHLGARKPPIATSEKLRYALSNEEGCDNLMSNIDDPIQAASDPSPAPVKRKRFKIPKLPHMEPAQIEYLAEAFGSVQCFLEYGAGGSTMLAARHNVPMIVSVESDTNFAKDVIRAVNRQGTESTLTMTTVKVGETGPWGMPVNRDRSNKWPDYSLSVWKAMEDKEISPDLVLIDGRFRVACFLATMIHGNAGTVIAFDDYTREKRGYNTVERFLKPDDIIDRMAMFTVPKEIDRFRLAMELVRYAIDPR